MTNERRAELLQQIEGHPDDHAAMFIQCWAGPELTCGELRELLSPRPRRQADAREEHDMTRAELNVFFQEWFCGCGNPEVAAETLRVVLTLHPLYDHQKEIDALIPNDGVRLLLLYTIDHFDLTEHGTGIGGGWLTDKGKSVLAALEREKALDNYASLFEQSCIHGVSIERGDYCAECE